MIQAFHMAVLHVCVWLLVVLALSAVVWLSASPLKRVALKIRGRGRLNLALAFMAVAVFVVYGGTKQKTVHTVTFDVNGGEQACEPIKVVHGSAVGKLPETVRSGYDFAGWFTAAKGGTAVTAATVVVADVKWYAQWTNNTAVVDVDGDDKQMTPDDKDGDASSDSPVHEGDASDSTKDDGKDEGATPDSKTPETSVEPETPVQETTGEQHSDLDESTNSVEHVLYEDVAGAVPSDMASIYDGYLIKDGVVSGAIQVKVGKPNANTGVASIKSSIVLNGKKVSLKAEDKGKAVILESEPTVVTLIGGEACSVALGTDGMVGKYGAYAIDGGRNRFASKSKSEASAADGVLSPWQGAVNVAWDGGVLTAAIAKKGKVRVTGSLADGTKVSASSQFIIGDKWCCVPVVWIKKESSLAFTLWFPKNGTSGSVSVGGLDGNAIAGKPNALKAGAKFGVSKDAALWSELPGKILVNYLPDGVPVKNDSRWILPKAGKVAYAKGTTVVDSDKAGSNPSGLKLTCKAKDGSFKGSFNVYADNGGRLKSTNVSVVGVLIDGVGYGIATIKKVAGYTPVAIQ